MAFSDEIKSEALERAGSKCECTRNCSHHKDRKYCNLPVIMSTSFAHHIVPIKEGGSDEFSNCEIYCKLCHKNARIYSKC